MNLRKILTILFFVIAIVGLFYFFIFANGNNLSLLEIRREVTTPPPLIRSGENELGILTRSGVFDLTNQERINNELDSFLTNELLDSIAEIKANDMIDRGYFAHDAPTGEGVADLAVLVGYEFMSVGENLAMGDFLDDQELVDGWMNSPGHRENILNKNHIEMGVAVKRGVINGRETWFAVQIFGLPASVCPEVDEIFLMTINNKEAELILIQEKMNEMKKEIESTIPRNNRMMREYNALVNEYNRLVNELKSLINEYNRQIELINRCINEYRS